MIRFSLSFLVAVSLLDAAEPADLLITARYVVTMDAERRVIENGAVVTKSDRIQAVGDRAVIEKAYTAKRRIDAGNSLVMPGLINTHTHAPMVLFRGIADDLKLQDWLENYIFPAEAKNVTPEFVRIGTRLACAEMLLSGTTTYADMYYFEDVIAEATKECGMRGVLGQTVIGFPVADAKTQPEALARSEAFLKRYAHDPLVTPAIAPHAPYTVPDDLMKAARALANKYKAPLLIHLSETRKENDDMRARRQLSPTQVLDSLGTFDGRTLVAHGIWVDDTDLAILQNKHVGVAHCPSSNMKLASGIAPLLKYLNRDIAVGLGTDGAAGSNNDLNMLEEIDLAGKLQKVTSSDPTALNAKQAVEMATIRGARALGMENEIGSIEPGKRADLITIRLTGPHAVPLFDVYSHIASVLKGSDVQHVVVNGRVVVRNRQVLTLNMPKVLQDAEAAGKAVQRSVRR